MGSIKTPEYLLTDRRPKTKSALPGLKLEIDSTKACILVQLSEPILTRLERDNTTSVFQTLNSHFISFLPAMSNT